MEKFFGKSEQSLDVIVKNIRESVESYFKGKRYKIYKTSVLDLHINHEIRNQFATKFVDKSMLGKVHCVIESEKSLGDKDKRITFAIYFNNTASINTSLKLQLVLEGVVGRSNFQVGSVKFKCFVRGDWKELGE